MNWNSRFGDYYFTPGEGINESAHVFFRGNDLPRRIPLRLRSPGSCFVIGETGFGTGLNLLLLIAWLSLHKKELTGRVCFFSVDMEPPDPKIRSQILTRELEVTTFSDTGFPSPKLISGFLPGLPEPNPVAPAWSTSSVRLSPELQVDISLFTGDVMEFCTDMKTLVQVPVGGVDAWFLDGHSPARNPRMWGEELFAHIAGLCASAASAASYTAAGSVKRALRSSGFSVRRLAGYGRKRHMISAIFESGAEHA